MRVRTIVGAVLVVAAAGMSGSALAAGSSPVPAACVVVNGPNGATVQAGYAPNGPAGCTALP